MKEISLLNVNVMAKKNKSYDQREIKQSYKLCEWNANAINWEEERH